MSKYKTNRIEKQLKVSRQPQGKTYVPGFRLAGQYMHNLGFREGDHVDMVADNEVIIIRKQCANSPKLSDLINKNPVLLSLISAFDLVPDGSI